MLIKKSKLTQKNKGSLAQEVHLVKLICTYRRRREKKEKTHKISKRIQFLIEDKG